MTSSDQFPLLETIESPAQLRELSPDRLETLAREVRQFMVESVSRTGGHLAASLGTVELTIALHYIFNTPEDRLVWDVGHQSYTHKILTGRRNQMSRLRMLGGISGFPRRDESPYDSFGVGHSSTSISAALGIATAARLQGSSRKSVAIIGDGAMTAGQAFEALNHAGDMDADLLVILNDNDMSISPNVGALSNYLARILSGAAYTRVREGGKQMLKNMPPMHELARRAEEHMKGMVVPGTLFEEMNFNYIGPIDGHDLQALVKTLRNVHALKGPQLLHVVTQKGKGYKPAEASPSTFHGVGKFDPQTGKGPSASPTTGPTYTQVFGNWLIDAAERDQRLVAITPAMTEGSGMVEFGKRFPDRCLDVGIAEQHSLTLAAGLACEGMHPVVAIYSTFLQRAYDQLIHDIALQNLPVTFAIDRAGLVGPDGPTHAGSFDLSYLRCIPNMVVMAPADENECRRMLQLAYSIDGPTAVRYPRGSGPGVEVDSAAPALPLGEAEVVRKGHCVALLAFGSMVQPALEVGDRLDVTVVNMRFVKPLDATLVKTLAESHDLLVTLEENAIKGGAGSAVNEALAAEEILVPILNLGLADSFLEQGSREQLLAASGLDSDSICSTVSARMTALDCPGTQNRLIS